jgi:hypothetical protein
VLPVKIQPEGQGMQQDLMVCTDVKKGSEIKALNVNAFFALLFLPNFIPSNK